jgi:hypothetical protein
LAKFKGVVTRDITAKLAGVGHGTLAKMERAVEAAEGEPRGTAGSWRPSTPKG